MRSSDSERVVLVVAKISEERGPVRSSGGQDFVQEGGRYQWVT